MMMQMYGDKKKEKNRIFWREKRAKFAMLTKGQLCDEKCSEMKAEVASRVKEMMKGDRELAVKRKKKVKELWKESINQTMGGL